jgi:hypothetical protein
MRGYRSVIGRGDRSIDDTNRRGKAQAYLAALGINLT